MKRILLIIYLQYFHVLIDGVWTNFDLVRPWKDAWGSKGITPYIKITGIGSITSSVNSSYFGSSISVIGDLNNDGIDDLVVGAIGEGTFNKKTNFTTYNSGSIYILFLTINGTVKSFTRITGYSHPRLPLISNDRFGSSSCKWKDNIIAVGAPGTYIGSLFLIYLHTNGTIEDVKLIRGKENGNGPALDSGSSFGSSLANMGGILYYIIKLTINHSLLL